jgi:hypothetical protein
MSFLLGCERAAEGSRSGEPSFDASPSTGAAVSPSGPLDSALASRASAVVDEYLKLTHVDAVQNKTAEFFICAQEGPTDKWLAIASHRVIAVVARDDGLVVSAEVQTVASLTASSTTANVLDGVVLDRVDTLSWVVEQEANTKRVGICGFSREGFDLMRARSGANVSWSPSERDWSSAIANAVRHRQTSGPR